MTRLSILVAVAAVAFCSCDSRRAETSAPEPIRQLNEIPIPQLRVFLKGYPGEWRPDSDREHARPVPPTGKPIPANAKRVPLVAPENFHIGDLPVREAISTRRSVREFSAGSVSFEELSYLLWAAQGVTGIQRDESGKVIQEFRAAPSGGARYPLETYLVIRRAEQLEPGLYRYLPSEHQLLLVREDEGLADQLTAACYGTPAVAGAAAIFVWSAVPYRTEWKYTYLAHRMIAMEAGHVCENIYLAATSCGVATCAALSYHQPLVDRLLGLDGEDEFTIYLACVGRPIEEDK